MLLTALWRNDYYHKSINAILALYIHKGKPVKPVSGAIGEIIAIDFVLLQCEQVGHDSWLMTSDQASSEMRHTVCVKEGFSYDTVIPDVCDHQIGLFCILYAILHIDEPQNLWFKHELRAFSMVVWESDWNIASCTHSHTHTHNMIRLLLNCAAAHTLSINTAEY